jgi:dTDP-4-amino-4,6-dideoxygalactose transaminase
VYSEERERAQKNLGELGIRTTTYWPLPPMLPQPQLYPQASWIYNHVFSIQIDQRYTPLDMEYLGKALARL